MMADSNAEVTARELDARTPLPEPAITPVLPRQSTGEAMPRQFAPLIRNAWYVIAEHKNVDRTLKAITVLGEPLVYYRSEAGDPIVLDDRCAHRFYPLSKSTLMGDSIRCRYHGYTYNSEGKCTFVPGHKGPINFGVRRYPAARRGPWLWVWMGPPEAANERDIPLDELPDAYAVVPGYVFNECNYMLVIENLLDLTHAHYLHGPDAADEIYAATPPEGIDVAGGVGLRKVIEATELTTWGTYCGDDPKRMVHRVEESRMAGPNLFDYWQSLSPLDRHDEPLRPTKARAVHALTPQDLTHTHQFFYLGLDQPIVIPEEDLLQGVLTAIFADDLDAVRWQMEAITKDSRAGLVERRMPGDRFAMRMLALLKQRAAQEAA